MKSNASSVSHELVCDATADAVEQEAEARVFQYASVASGGSRSKYAAAFSLVVRLGRTNVTTADPTFAKL